MRWKMKKIKLFHKFFICTFLFMLLIVIVSHELLYFLSSTIAYSFDLSNSSTITETVKDFPLHTQLLFQTDDYIGKVIRAALPYSLIICVFISFVSSILLTKIITTPILNICNETIRMSNLNGEAKIEEYDCYEMNLLSQNINFLYKSFLKNIENLEQEKRKVCEIEEQRIDFLQAASHELKTPITSLSLILENMLLKVGKYKQTELYLSKCKQITDDLSHMVTNLLESSKLNAFIDEEKSKFELTAMIHEVFESFTQITQSKNISVHFNMIHPIYIYSYPNLLKNALNNIISNAVLYTETEGHVDIIFKNNKLTINNECCPIPEHQLKHIFEPFYRLDFSRSKNTGGSGLGLYFTESILRRLDLPYSFTPTETGMQFEVDFT